MKPKYSYIIETQYHELSGKQYQTQVVPYELDSEGNRVISHLDSNGQLKEDEMLKMLSFMTSSISATVLALEKKGVINAPKTLKILIDRLQNEMFEANDKINIMDKEGVFVESGSSKSV